MYFIFYKTTRSNFFHQLVFIISFNNYVCINQMHAIIHVLYQFPIPKALIIT